MPWEIDHALLVFDKLKQSSYFINKEDTLYLDTALNLSDKFIDWKQSKLPKEYFIEKYKMLDDFIKPKFNHKSFIYEGEEAYGSINILRSMYEPHIDYYIPLCPDINFQEHLLYYLIESAKQIKNEYFILTPQIYKCWDPTWDVIVNKKFMDVEYDDCLSTDIHYIRNECLSLGQPILKKVPGFKYAGWFDLYSKSFLEKLAPVLDEWNGYGPWDLYTMNVCYIAKQYKVDVQQYILENQVVWFSDTGCLNNQKEYGGDGRLKTLYQDLLFIKTIGREQRKKIDDNLIFYLQKWFKYAKQNKIIFYNTL